VASKEKKEHYFSEWFSLEAKQARNEEKIEYLFCGKRSDEKKN